MHISVDERGRGRSAADRCSPPSAEKATLNTSKNLHALFNDITTIFPLKVTAMLQQKSEPSFDRDLNHRSRAPPLHAVVDRDPSCRSELDGALSSAFMRAGNSSKSEELRRPH